MEQRKEIRTAVYKPVDVVSGKLRCPELLQNISPDGAYIETQRRLPVGEPLMLAAEFPSFPETIFLACRVVRNDARGMGVRFTDTPCKNADATARQADPGGRD